MKVSVIVPTLNEAGNIEKVLQGIAKQDVNEILIVDGHSTDGTIEIVKNMGYNILLQEKKGLGYAVRQGVANTKGDIIIVVDADGSHDTKDIPKLVDKIKEGYDLVVASRYISGPKFKGLFFFKRQSSSYDDTFIREIGNRIFTYSCRKIFKLKIHDVLMGFKAFRREVFEQVPIDAPGQEYDAEVLIRAQKKGFKVGEVPTVEYRRETGRSKLNAFYHGVQILKVIIREWIRS